MTNILYHTQYLLLNISCFFPTIKKIPTNPNKGIKSHTSLTDSNKALNSFYLPFSTTLAFFVDRGPRDLVCFFAVENTVTPDLAFFADNGTRGLEFFFAEEDTINTGFIFFNLEAKVIAWMVSGQKNGFCN